MLDGRNTNENNDLLIQRAISGEASAFGLLYDKYQPAIYRFIYLKVGHREEAEDLTHQSFLSAWQNIETFRDQGLPISSWLYRIARNKVIDHYRTKKVSVNLDDIFEDINQEKTDGEEEIIKKIDLERVYESLLELTPDQQDIIIMRFVEELSYKEIAKATGKNQGAIRVLQHRAIQNLKKVMKKYEE